MSVKEGFHCTASPAAPYKAVNGNLVCKFGANSQVRWPVRAIQNAHCKLRIFTFLTSKFHISPFEFPPFIFLPSKFHISPFEFPTSKFHISPFDMISGLSNTHAHGRPCSRGCLVSRLCTHLSNRISPTVCFRLAEPRELATLYLLLYDVKLQR